MKSNFLLAFCMLTILSCSTIDDSENSTTNNENNNGVLALNGITKISSTPFNESREAIVYNDELYVVDDFSTYKYDFTIDNWNGIQTQNNIEGIDIAVNPVLEHNVSFIRDKKWYILNSNTLSSFDLKENEWTIVKEFSTDESIESPDGFYENGTLYIYSDEKSTMYTYDFEVNKFDKLSSYNVDTGYGQLGNSFLKINNEYYFVKLSDYKTTSIYKLNADYTELTLLNEYVENNLIKGNAFVYENSIIFGLGGDTPIDGNTTKYELNDTFYNYDIATNSFKTVINKVPDGRYAAQPITHNNELYLLGGVTFLDENQANYKSLDLLSFGLVIE